MTTYDFANLSPFDFEGLIRGLLEAELRVRIERFSTGRDKGIDLRYATATDGTLVVQCKHYPNSDYRLVLRAAKKEAVKVAAIAPDRYKFVTSSRLTPARKDELYYVFTQFMRTAAEDVYGEADVNALLERHPSVEIANFKLWLTSTAVLQTVLHNDIFVRTQNLQDSIQDKLRIYVQNASFQETRRILADQHVCIIAGVPGIGKTMLADMLLVALTHEGFSPVAVSDDITEALDLYRATDAQVFYYDDFLGQTTLLAKLGKNEDARLIDFVEQVRRAPNKRFILTTREYILAQARHRYERLSREDFDVMKCVVSLDSYTRFDRARILYNHTYFSGLDSAYHDALLTDRSYLKIVDHRNYSPRIIQSVIKLAQQAEISREDFVGFFSSALDNPEQIWRHAYENQLEVEAQSILLLLAAMPPDVDVDKLRVAYRGFHEARAGVAPVPGSFNRALRTLEDNFVAVETLREKSVARFHNPSVRDFMHRKLDEEPEEYSALIATTQYWDQVELLARYAGVPVVPIAEVLALEPVPTFSGLRLRVTTQPEGLMDALRRTLHAPECGVSLFRAGAHRFVRDVDPASPESRLRFAVHCVRILGNTMPTWLRQELDAIDERWISGVADKAEVVELIKELDKSARDVADRKVGVAKEWFLESLEEPSDFGALVELRAARPSIVDAEEFEASREGFLGILDYAFHRMLASATNYGELERSYGDLRELAEYYGIRLTDVIDVGEYEQILRELGEAEDWSGDEDEEHWRDERDAREEEESAIDSLFDSLRSE